MDKIRKEYITRTAEVYWFRDKVREVGRRRFGQIVDILGKGC